MRLLASRAVVLGRMGELVLGNRGSWEEGWREGEGKGNGSFGERRGSRIEKILN